MTLIPSLHHPWNTYLKPLYCSSPFHSFFSCPLCPFFVLLLLCITILALEVSVSFFYLKCQSWTYPRGHMSRRETLLPSRETPGSCVKTLISLASFPALTVVLNIVQPGPTQASIFLCISLTSSLISRLYGFALHP